MGEDKVKELLIELLLASFKGDKKRGRELADALLVAKLRQDTHTVVKIGRECVDDPITAMVVITAAIDIAIDLFTAGLTETDGDKLAALFQEWNESAKVAKES